jgi:2-deoxy-D-gluconate 3-dehydrogenase
VRNVMEMFDLKGKVAVVTGSASGIGQAMAVSLAEAGADIAGVYNITSPDETKALVEKTGKKYYPVHFDLSKAEKAPAIIEKAVKLFGEIHILVNCAGVHNTTSYGNFSFDEYSKVIEVNQNAIVSLSIAASNQFVVQGKGGKIINVGSMAGLVPPPMHLAYCTSKQAISGITMAMAVDLAKKKINVNAIAPGFILTKMLSKAADEKTLAKVVEKIPAGRLGLPEDFKGVAVFLASHASDFVNGQTILIDGAHANSLNL